MYFGNMSQANLPPLARTTLGVSPPSPDLKFRLPCGSSRRSARTATIEPTFPLSSSLSKGPVNVNAVNTKTEALMVPAGFTLATPLKRRHSACGVCRLKFNSEMQALSHYSGTRHVKRLKALGSLDTQQNRTSEPGVRETPLQQPQPPPLHALPPPGPSVPCRSDTSDVPATPSAREEAESPSGAGTDTALKGEGPDPGAPSSHSSYPSPCPPGQGTAPEAPGDGERVMTAVAVGMGVGAERVEEVAVVEEEKESEEDKAMRLLYCSLCKVAVNSASQLQAHNSGTKHKTMLEARRGGGAIKSFPRSGVKAKYAAASASASASAAAPAPADGTDASSTGLQNKTFHCEICDVHVNSETQLKQHISSRRHKDRAAGKPAKPKFSPYPATPRQHGLQAVRLALRKETDHLTKPLAPPTCLLHRHLNAAAAAAAAMATMVPFHLRPGTASSPALFQNQPLPQALLAAAAPPLCSSAHAHALAHTHTPLLFSPF